MPLPQHQIAQAFGHCRIRPQQAGRAHGSDGKRWHRFGVEQGLPANAPFFMAEDGAGRLVTAGGRVIEVTAMADSGINKIEARKMYRKAENTYAMALAIFGEA